MNQQLEFNFEDESTTTFTHEGGNVIREDEKCDPNKEMDKLTSLNDDTETLLGFEKIGDNTYVFGGKGKTLENNL